MLKHSNKLLVLTIRNSLDVVMARQRARQIAALLGYDIQEQTHIGASVSEIVRNTHTYAGTGQLEFSIVDDLMKASLMIQVYDRGPGIRELAKILAGNYKSPSGTRGGIFAAKQLINNFNILSAEGKGTQVKMWMAIPRRGLPLTQQKLASIADQLARYRPNRAADEVRQQNQELLQALDLLKEARDELEQRVDERTAQLKLANNALQQEMAQRLAAERLLNQRQQELAEAARISSMGEMGSAIAHELNQPLTTIATFTQGSIRRLKMDPSRIDEILSAMQIVAQQAERAGEIIHRMKDLVRKGTINKEWVDVNNLIHEVVTLMQYEIPDLSKIIKLELQNNLPQMNFDKIQVEQVIINLIRNSVEAMQEANIAEPLITIYTALMPSQNMLELNVIDNGPGFSAKLAEKLLEPYFTTKKKGTGMGLSISRTIIENHAGRMQAIAQPTGGARFQIILPVNNEDE